jgi:dephospho-CoA kinase
VLSVGLTGNVASGKSAVARHFGTWGATVIDADHLVRDVQTPGGAVLAAIVARFGSTVLLPSGELDRATLRRLVFNDDAARADLNAIVHPAVRERRATLLGEADRRGDLIVVNDIPLLFEVLDPEDFDVIVLVDAPEPVRRERLIQQRGLSATDATRMIAAQLPSDGKRARSHVILDNDGSLDDLEMQARTAWSDVRRRAARAATMPDAVLLAVTAHPDDGQLIAGTLARYVDAGAAVHQVSATGTPNAPAGVSTVALERPGSIVPDDQRAVTALVGLMQRIRPHAILTFGPDGGNGDPDHRAVHTWTRRATAAARITPDIHYIATAPSDPGTPLVAALDVRPWRRDPARTACGMGFDPARPSAVGPGREWYAGTRAKVPPLTDLFPPANRG